MALVTSSISARPLVMGGVIGGITAVDSTLPAIRAPSTVFPHDEVRAGIWAWLSTPVMIAAEIAPTISDPSIVFPHPAGSAGTFAAAIAEVSADPAMVTPAPIAPAVRAAAPRVTPAGMAPAVSAAAVRVALVIALTNSDPSIVFPHPAGSDGMWVAAINRLAGSIGANRLCGCTMAVMKLPTAVAAL